MSKPKTKNEFSQYCLRTLGAPVINIEITSEQIDDRIDQGFAYYVDHHFDGSDKMYYKWMIQANDYPDVVKSVMVANGGVGYSNSDSVLFTPKDGIGSNGTGTIVTNGNGSIITVAISNTGSGFQMIPNAIIDTISGSGANVVVDLGGYITIPDNVIGVVDIFDIQDAISSSSFFSLKYQIALNDLYSFFNQSLVPYYMIRMHLSSIEELLVGKQPIRYNRHKKKMYLDMDWHSVIPGQYLIISCYEVVDPAIYPEIWSDYWLHRYCVALLKQNWGSNISKYGSMTMPGGIQFNGQRIYDEGTAEVLRLEAEMINSYSPILSNMIG